MGDMGARLGMLVVETMAKIRRAYFAQKKPIKVICRELRVSRRVVRKVIRSQATEFRYERGRQPLPRIDPWRDQLDGLLLENESKPARERLTLIRIFEGLRALGYEGSYDAIRRYARRWRAERGAAMAEAYIPLSFAPGEAYQCDWSHEIVLINGVTVAAAVRRNVMIDFIRNVYFCPQGKLSANMARAFAIAAGLAVATTGGTANAGATLDREPYGTT